MFVTDSMSASSVKLTIFNVVGHKWEVNAMPEFTIEKLKLMALSHFYNPLDKVKQGERYKLVYALSKKPLSDESTVREEDIKDNAILLLVERRFCTSNEKDLLKFRSPTEEEIKHATQHVQEKNSERKMNLNPVVVDFQTELKKILVSLIDASEKMLRTNPEIDAILKEPEVTSTEESTEEVLDPVALKQLTDMGFPRDKAMTALKINKMSAEEAMDWLLVSASDDDMQKDTESEISNSTISDSVDFDMSTPSSSQMVEAKPHSYSRVSRILECYTNYRRKQFKPNRKALNTLKEMGFTEFQVLDALRINNNNQEAACDWLLGNKKQQSENIGDGLDPDGPIYKAIMSNAQVQLGLSNPKTFFILLQMLENPNGASRWLSDPDTAPLLSHIFRIYHAEKHSLQLASSFLFA